MRSNYFLSVARTLLILAAIMIMPINGAVARTPDELRTRLDEVEVLLAERHKLLEQEGVVVREMDTTTNLELELRLRKQHQEILRKVTKNDKSRLNTFRGAVDLLSGYGPDSRSEWKAAMRETKRLVRLLKMERHMILGNSDTPDELVSERGIDKLLEGAVGHLSVLDEKQQDGVMAWFDRQDTAVKAALIAAIVSILGTLATIVVAIIRRRQ